MARVANMGAVERYVYDLPEKYRKARGVEQRRTFTVVSEGIALRLRS